MKKHHAKILAELNPRPINVIAREILANWRRPDAGALPYLHAMLEIDQLMHAARLNDGRTVHVLTPYGAEDSVDVVSRFLSNASAWRGDIARLIKAELKGLLAAAHKVSP